MICFPNAKINLGLYVTEKRPDGYHNLETVFLPVPLQDVLEIKPLDFYDAEYELQLAGLHVEGKPEDNLVVRVFLQMKHEFNLPPQTIYLYKRIPSGAGLGGGSSDAAFMMRLLNERFRLGLTRQAMEDRLATFGADCPFFIKNQPVFAEGIGDIFTDIDIVLKGKTLVLVKPDISVSTADAYSLVSPHKPQQSLRESLRLPVEEWKNHVVNDFESSVFKKFPEIAAIKDRLYDLGALYASMSGSGSAVYGIFNQPVQYVDEVFAGYFCRQRELDV